MNMHKVRVLPEDMSAFQQSASNSVEPPSILERCRRSTARRETQLSLFNTYRPPPPSQVKIVIFITAVVAIVIMTVVPASGWFVVKHGSCTAYASLWSIKISGHKCSHEIRHVSFSDYIWISRVLILVAMTQSLLTSLALYWYCVRMRIITVLEDAMDAVASSALFLIGSVFELAVAEGISFSRFADRAVYGIAFHALVVATSLAILAAVFFRLSIDWEDYYEKTDE